VRRRRWGEGSPSTRGAICSGLLAWLSNAPPRSELTRTSVSRLDLSPATVPPIPQPFQGQELKQVFSIEAPFQQRCYPSPIRLKPRLRTSSGLNRCTTGFRPQGAATGGYGGQNFLRSTPLAVREGALGLVPSCKSLGRGRIARRDWLRSVAVELEDPLRLLVGNPDHHRATRELQCL
jgi:hypothetical protein